ncbi:MAG: FecR domain-containing protein [Bacteroidota bacterium]|nr:FecR domain-containing protein [Bacteroidota bacterium]
MENSDQPIRAEDILTDDSLTEKLIEKKWQDEALPKEELLLSQDVFQAVKGRRVNFSQDQKYLLDARITQSIQKEKRKKGMAWFGSAAIMLVLAGLSVFFQLQNESDIRNFALSNPTNTDSKQTRLLLSDKEEITIDTKESRIEYSATGSQIKIDVQRNVEQPHIVEANSFNTVIVPYGKRSQITLSDNTKVWLNSGSKLVYPVKFVAKKREVFLEGEAIFEVSHDENHPFFVLTQSLDVKVLGTVFNLCAYSDESTISTVLESGSVELRFDNNLFTGQKKETMIPGMQAIFNPESKSLIQSMVKAKDYMSWKDGYVVLEKNSLESIAKRLSRYYNVTIEFENPELAAETFSGYLDLRNTAIQVLELISEIIDIDFFQVDDQIKISKKQKS